MDFSLSTKRADSLPLRRGSRAGQARHQESLLTRRLLVAAGLPLVLLLTLPVAVLALTVSPTTILGYMQDVETVETIRLSLVLSTATMALVILMGTPLAYLLARKQFRGRYLLEVVLDLPTVLPPAVAGLALLLTFGRNGLAGAWLAPLGLKIAFTPIAVVLAQLFVSAPYYIKAASISLISINRELEQAAALDGARSGEVFRYITLPLAWRGIIGGAVLSWARALGEFGATIIFAGNYPGRTQTMPLAVYLGFEIHFERALTLSVILLGLSFGILVTLRLMLTEAHDH